MEEKESWKREEKRLRKRLEELEGGVRGAREKEEEQRTEEEKEREMKDGKEERKWRKEKEERKNSIVISGVKWGKENAEREVEKWIEEAMKIRVKVRRAREISFRNGGQGMVAELGSWEKKRRVMGRKKELTEGVFNDNDIKEREVQQRLRRIALDERSKKGEYVRVGMGKIFLEELGWWSWDEEKGGLEEWGREERGREKRNEGGEPRESTDQDRKEEGGGEGRGSREKIDLR